jgi:two-component system, cell cycle response regulator
MRPLESPPFAHDPSLEDTQVLSLPLVAAPKVLLVDDDELILEHLKALVVEAGFTVFTARNADEALESLHRQFTPIVILDRNMPGGMDGLDLCRAIRRHTYVGYVYLVLLTIQDSEEDILAGLDAGADDYLSKRVSPAQLLARLRNAQRILTLEHSLKAALEERRRIAMTDALTGAYNRRYFMRHLGRELNRIRRFGGETSLLLLDIDHFKRINDSHGHTVGDEVLTAVVRRIAEALPRDTDWCARLGGEEFAVVLPQTGLAGAAVAAERLRAHIAANPAATSGGKIRVTSSIGVSAAQCSLNGEPVSVEELLSAADRCLYTSKESGRNRVTSGRHPIRGTR